MLLFGPPSSGAIKITTRKLKRETVYYKNHDFSSKAQPLMQHNMEVACE